MHHKPKTGLCQSFSIGWLPKKLDPSGNGIIVDYAIAGHWLLVKHSTERVAF
jgi:hypothetical protein